MAVKIRNRKYSEVFTNTSSVDWLLGNVGEWQKLLLDAEVSIDYQATQQNPIQIDYLNNSFVLNSGTWGQYGFDTGMSVTFRYKVLFGSDGAGGYLYVSSYQKTFQIVNISGTIMEVDEEIDGQGFQSLPADYGTRKVTDVLLYSSSPLQGTRLRYGHVLNNDTSNNLNSVIDGSTTEFIYVGLNSLPVNTWAGMEAVGLQSGMSVRQANVRKRPASASNLFVTLTAGTYTEQDLYTDFMKEGKSIPVTSPGSSGGFFTVTSQSEVPINNSGIYQGGANQNQAFLFNNAGSFTRDFIFDIKLKFTDATGALPGDSASIVLVKYTNGTAMDIVNRTVLQSWINPQELLNEHLEFKGHATVELNTSDSLVLVIEHAIPQDRTGGQGISYLIEDLTIQVSNENETLTLGEKQNFQFELEYLVSSFFEEVGNFVDVTPPSYLQGDGSLSDNFYTEFYPEWNNPNVKIVNDPSKTKRLGNTGWFNENYNQLSNDFTVTDLVYTDDNGNGMDGLDYFATTRVRAKISGVQNVNGNTKGGFGFMWVPKFEEDYKNKTTPFYRNTFINTGGGAYDVGTFYPDVEVGGGLGLAWMEVKNVKFTDMGGGVINFEAFFTPSPDFTLLFDQKGEDDRNYILWLSIADQTLAWNFSNRVSLLADYNKMIKSVPPAGPYPFIENVFIEHPYESNVQGVEEYDGFVHDDVLCRVPFQVDPTTTQMRKFRFGVEVFNLSTNSRKILEKYDVDMTQYYTDVNGVPQFSLNASRGFKLGDNNNKNWVKINREPSYDSAGKYGYLGFYAFKIRWEDWIALTGLPNDFFKAGELNSGFNNDWYQLLITTGWRLNFFVEIDAIVDTELIQYRNRWNFNFKDYDQNTRLQTSHSYFRDSDDTYLNVGSDPETGKPLGVVLSNEPTRLEIQYEILDAGTWDIDKVYATTTIEVDKGAGFMSMRQISSVWTSEPDCPLIPLQGQNHLQIVVDGTQKILTTKCLIDPDLLEDGSRYRITGRVGCYDGTGAIRFGIYESIYESRYE
jgi:hypothetical protein